MEAPMSEFREQFGKLVQERRGRLGLSQAQLGKKANLSLKYVGEIERGEANVSISAMESVCFALELQPFASTLVGQTRMTVPEAQEIMSPSEIQSLGLHVTATVLHKVAERFEAAAVGTLDRAPVEPEPQLLLPSPRRRGRPRRPKKIDDEGRELLAADFEQRCDDVLLSSPAAQDETSPAEQHQLHGADAP
jgi:transcriptional regulator with XRE-family HTH domain